MKGSVRSIARAGTRRRVLSSHMLAATVLLSLAGLAKADCFDDAAQYHKINPWVLRAIAAQESGFKPLTIGRNSNNTVDIGEFGINSVHLPELAKYGISKEDLLDGCKSAYVASWRLAKMVRKYGNSWIAVGAYHSENPGPRDLYAALIQRTINFWIARRVIPTS